MQLEACRSDYITAESGDFTAIDSNFTANGCIGFEGYLDPNALAKFNCNRTTHSCANARWDCSATRIDFCHIW